MKHKGILKACIALIILCIIFIIIWMLKLRSPMTPVDPYQNGLDENAPWWQVTPNEKPTVDDEWQLDPEIPANYIPVLGGDELYMVVDENGNILKYRHRTKQADGSWLWEDVNPDIPQNYEPVPGLENVYKVTEADGSVHYYRYVRNADDTYYFIEVDENGNPIKSDALTDDAIPANYVHVGNNIYAVYNEHGVLIGYKMRVLNADGTYSWIDCDPPASGGQFQGGGIPGLQGGGQGGQGGQGSGQGTSQNVHDTHITTERGYREQHTQTDTKQEGDWMVVYQTIITREYDEHGNLISTKKEGPTELNRFPATEVNTDIINKAQASTTPENN